MTSKTTRIGDVKRAWHKIDVANQVLGRIASEIAKLLSGKNKAYFVRHLDCGDYVVVLNAKRVKVTGKKEQQKIYSRFSGYPSGLKKTTLEMLRATKPEEIIRHAVYGMLPNNKLRPQMMKRLFVFSGNDHAYGDKFLK